ncbi:MAG: nucleotidyl transferase AbiEii/AbiGii toxin family protein [Elusimicrobia bacterium]|jgi:predicted nucleotidyltransferase component of viral defense system|nr:nucleotidyl transferase AbiEii/AbiGii toxin family protein [Elusimicrobiota bacterium]
MNNKKIYNQLQKREVFHLEFLRNFSKMFRPDNYALKGGCNLRFFFDSFRYSEDMDIDINGIRMELLRDRVMDILENNTFKNTIRTFGINKIIPPNMKTAKQTQTTQRFKVHLITFAGEDLFTKVEFSRRGINDKKNIETISSSVLREYKIAPLIVSHYTAHAAVIQKTKALAFRKIPQARDFFDLYILLPKTETEKLKGIEKKILQKAVNTIYAITFKEFRDHVVLYLAPDDMKTFDSAAAWEEIQLKVINYIEEQKNE